MRDISRISIVVMALTLSLGAATAEPKYDGTSFVGLPVFARDGFEVGEVVSETYDEDGAPDTLRISVAQTLGLGEKIIEVPRDRYVGLRGAVTLDIVADAVEQLPPDSP